MFKIYYTNPHNEAGSIDYTDLADALKHSAQLREDGNTFVTIVSENPDCTSKPGVDTVKDIANYDGWISRGRAP